MLKACTQRCLPGGDKRRHQYHCTQVRRQGEKTHSPFCTLAGGAEVGISQPVNSKAKHVICFQCFAEQITITTTILGDNKGSERNISFYLPGNQGLGERGAFHHRLFPCLWSWRVYAKRPWLRRSAWLTTWPQYTLTLGI